MAIATPMTLQDYLNFDDGTDTRYELVEGELIAMPPESDLHDRIASFLYAYFLQLGVSYTHLSMKIQIAVSGKLATARQPDLTVLSDEAAEALKDATQRLITHDMPPPALVVEVVSPKQENRDYRYKRTEYAGRHISEYWIVDPKAQKVTGLNWIDGLYEEKIYQGDQVVESLLFSNFALTAAQILAAEY
ncbi:MAG: Uma2 family endonuclease [Thainema sp.]